MAFFPTHHIPQDCLKGTNPDGPLYKGLLVGCVPIYIGRLSADVDSPTIAARNWVPEWTVTLASTLYNLAAQLYVLLGGDPPPGFMLTITERLDGTPLDEDPDLQD